MIGGIDIRADIRDENKEEINRLIQVVGYSFLNNLDELLSIKNKKFVRGSFLKEEGTFEIFFYKGDYIVKKSFDYNVFKAQNKFEKQKNILTELLEIFIKLNKGYNWNIKKELDFAYKKTINKKFNWSGILFETDEIVVLGSQSLLLKMKYQYQEEEELINLELLVFDKNNELFYKNKFCKITPKMLYLVPFFYKNLKIKKDVFLFKGKNSGFIIEFNYVKKEMKIFLRNEKHWMQPLIEIEKLK